MWNNFVFPFFNVDVSINQESALSPILSVLYITSIFHIFEKRSKFYFKILLFLFFLLWIIVFLFHRKNLLKKQTLFFFVIIILCHLSLTSSDLWLNIENQRFSIFLDQLRTLTLHLWIFLS